MTTTDATTTRTPLTLEDVPALTALLNRIDRAEELDDPAEELSIREWLTMPGLDLARDSLAVRRGGELIGAAIVDVHTSVDRDGRVRCQLMGGVDPAHRRQGLGTELLAWSEERAAALAAQRHPQCGEAVFRTSGGRDPRPGTPAGARVTGGAGVRPLLDRRGYRRARSWLVMVRELPGAAVDLPVPDGARILAPSDAQRDPTREAHLAAFADHWGSAPISQERWSTLWSSHTARRELSTVALDADGTVLAYAVTSEDRPGVLHIALVGTRPDARGRGLARAVLARTLAAGAEAGYGRAELEVDAESLTGATRLYDALGFVTEHVDATYEKPVAPVEPAR
ncbi:GNAT family N-acetyltransferase [Brachybacterium saurashtrense]|uniref:GNAT family N-acetyltransferase n=1 Tax=Brachybacterium saurashtrense TaxID=556288 RepID=A0A345YKC5_9MICO|nr:GNAT family N-acetyltransferase [Brachybacterium saurashtrense]AXK44377.1 GNAT family N-acetyltransferase [Brachybacterium saurashtrense]RRR22988.1 GNAT family N-acetyltransferase [Brachybacterium saurashtrense]